MSEGITVSGEQYDKALEKHEKMMDKNHMILRAAARMYAYQRGLSVWHPLKYHFDALTKHRRNKYIGLATEAFDVFKKLHPTAKDKELEIVINNAHKDSGKQFIITVTNDPKFPYWVAREDGEGMSMSEKNLYDVFDMHFENHF